MKKLLALLCLLCVPAFAGNTIDIGGLPTPTNGVITLQPGDILPANRTGVTYQLQYPSSIVASSAPAGTLTGTTLAANVVNSSLTSAAGGAFGTGAYATQVTAGNITGTTLASNVVTSSLTTVGTIATGTWHGTAIGTSYLPSGIVIGSTSPAQGDILYYTGSAWADLGYGTSGYVLATQGASANPHWVAGGGTVTTTGSPTSGNLAAFTGSTSIGSTTALPSGTTATTQSASDSSTKVATTAFANPSTTNAAAGSVTLPGGTIIKWGTATSSGTSTGNVTITFGTAFPNNCYSLTGTVQNATGHIFGVTSISTTGAVADTSNTSGNFTSGDPVGWMAIGN